MRAKIIKHSDGVELFIKPYPILRLIPKIISEYFIYWIMILVFGAPVWAVYLFAGGELISSLNFSKNITDILNILIIPSFLVLFFIGFNLFLLIREHLKDFDLHIRISKDNYCAIYKRNPKKSIYIDNKNKITISAIKSSYNMPNGKGKKSEFWRGIQINIPKQKKPLKRTALTHKDLDIIKEFKTFHFH